MVTILYDIVKVLLRVVNIIVVDVNDTIINIFAPLAVPELSVE